MPKEDDGASKCLFTSSPQRIKAGGKARAANLGFQTSGVEDSSPAKTCEASGFAEGGTIIIFFLQEKFQARRAIFLNLSYPQRRHPQTYELCVIRAQNHLFADRVRSVRRGRKP
jgi:hypothetical protein